MRSSLSKNSRLVLISEASKILGVSIDTIRRWDKKGILHSQRIDGKNRFFSISDLEKAKLGQGLPISEASKFLGISPTTLRRLDKKGLIKPDRNSAGERIYTRQSLEKFLNGEYFLRQKQIEAIPTPTPAQKVLSALQVETRQEVSKLIKLKQIFLGLGLTVSVGFVLLISIITLLFMFFPQATGNFFGYKIPDKGGAKVLGIQFSQPLKEEGSVLGAVLKPFSQVSLGIVKQLSPKTYQQIVPETKVKDVNDVLTVDQNGNVQSKFNLTFPDTSFLKIPDQKLIENLNAQFLQGKEPGVNSGNLAVFGAGGTIEGLIDQTGITTISSDSSPLTVTTKNHASALKLDLTNVITTDYLKAGAVTNSKLANSVITFAADSGTSASSSLGDTRTFSGAGIAATSISGSTLTITATEADTLATVTGRGATTTTANLRVCDSYSTHHYW